MSTLNPSDFEEDACQGSIGDIYSPYHQSTPDPLELFGGSNSVSMVSLDAFEHNKPSARNTLEKSEQVSLSMEGETKNFSAFSSEVNSPRETVSPTGEASSPYSAMESDGEGVETGQDEAVSCSAGDQSFSRRNGFFGASTPLYTTTPCASSSCCDDGDDYGSSGSRKKRRKTRKTPHSTTPLSVQTVPQDWQHDTETSPFSPPTLPNNFNFAANSVRRASGGISNASLPLDDEDGFTPENAKRTRTCGASSGAISSSASVRSEAITSMDTSTALPLTSSLQNYSNSSQHKIISKVEDQQVLNKPYPRRHDTYELRIIVQPESQHRARYLTEGSRGPVKDAAQTGFPKVQLIGYSKPAVLQVFVATDSGKVRPHGFYQACRVTGRNTSPCEEIEIEGTKVIEIPFKPDDGQMILSVDCVGILKLRNTDVEVRTGMRNQKRNQSVRLVFRVTLNPLTAKGQHIILQAASSRISCTQPLGQPEIIKKSIDRCSVVGGIEMFIIGRNFHRGTKVIYQDPEDPNVTQWCAKGEIEKDTFHQSHMVVRVPPYHDQNIIKPVNVQLIVEFQDKRCEPHSFTYTPKPKDTEILKEDDKNSSHTTSDVNIASALNMIDKKLLAALFSRLLAGDLANQADSGTGCDTPVPIKSSTLQQTPCSAVSNLNQTPHVVNLTALPSQAFPMNSLNDMKLSKSSPFPSNPIKDIKTESVNTEPPGSFDVSYPSKNLPVVSGAQSTILEANWSQNTGGMANVSSSLMHASPVSQSLHPFTEQGGYSSIALTSPPMQGNCIPCFTFSTPKQPTASHVSVSMQVPQTSISEEFWQKKTNTTSSTVSTSFSHVNMHPFQSTPPIPNIFSRAHVSTNSLPVHNDALASNQKTTISVQFPDGSQLPGAMQYQKTQNLDVVQQTTSTFRNSFAGADTTNIEQSPDTSIKSIVTDPVLKSRQQPFDKQVLFTIGVGSPSSQFQSMNAKPSQSILSETPISPDELPVVVQELKENALSTMSEMNPMNKSQSDPVYPQPNGTNQPFVVATQSALAVNQKQYSAQQAGDSNVFNSTSQLDGISGSRHIHSGQSESNLTCSDCDKQMQVDQMETQQNVFHIQDDSISPMTVVNSSQYSELVQPMELLQSDVTSSSIHQLNKRTCNEDSGLRPSQDAIITHQHHIESLSSDVRTLSTNSAKCCQPNMTDVKQPLPPVNFQPSLANEYQGTHDKRKSLSCNETLAINHPDDQKLPFHKSDHAILQSVTNSDLKGSFSGNATSCRNPDIQTGDTLGNISNFNNAPLQSKISLNSSTAFQGNSGPTIGITGILLMHQNNTDTNSNQNYGVSADVTDSIAPSLLQPPPENDKIQENQFKNSTIVDGSSPIDARDFQRLHNSNSDCGFSPNSTTLGHQNLQLISPQTVTSTATHVSAIPVRNFSDNSSINMVGSQIRSSTANSDLSQKLFLNSGQHVDSMQMQSQQYCSSTDQTRQSTAAQPQNCEQFLIPIDRKLHQSLPPGYNEISLQECDQSIAQVSSIPQNMAVNSNTGNPPLEPHSPDIYVMTQLLQSIDGTENLAAISREDIQRHCK